jgi:3,4-dihydroxy 2-butanone 4-phosphate synthase
MWVAVVTLVNYVPDLCPMRLAGLKPYGVLCELMSPDGTMARMPRIVAFARRHKMAVVSVEDIIQYRKS